MNGSIVLQNQTPNLSLAIFHVGRGCFILGRSGGCDFVVNDASVSRRHAEIAVVDGCVTVSDLGSSNGTFLDGKRILHGSAHLGQSLRFGKVTFTIASHTSEEKKFGPEEVTDKCGDPDEPLDAGRPNLSIAQHRVFNHLLQGLDDKQIAKCLSLSPHTVHNHLRAIYRIFQVHSRLELLAKVLGTSFDI